jgi:hypothetical protein
MSRLDIEQKLNDFQSLYPRPGIEKLNVEWYDLQTDWPKPWPSGSLPGVYIFLDPDENLLYIGKASSGRRIKTRLRAYYRDNQGSCLIKGKAKGSRYVGLLTLPSNRGFEAPAIEEYLITYCGENSENYPKLRNKIIVAKQARRKSKKQIEEFFKEQLKIYKENPMNVTLEIRNILINLEKQSKRQ